MPYSSAPTNDTYSSHRIPLVVDTTYRTGDSSFQKYTGMTNILPFQEMVEGEKQIYGETRYAMATSTVTGSLSFPKVCRGMYVWEKTVGTIYYFVVVDGTIGGSQVWTSTDGTTWTAVTTLTNRATTPVRFTEFIDSSTNTKSLIMVDGIEGYVFTSNAAGTKITDPDFPSPHVPFPIFLDGYLFLAKTNTGDIYNSDLNTPSSWTAGNFISAEMYPDDIQALVRIDNYILAIGTAGCEYFYDAGNSPGTPLARVEGAALPFGTLAPNAIATTRNSAVVLANTGDGESKFKYIEGLKFKDMPGPFIPQVLNSLLSWTTSGTVGFRGAFFRQKGDLFYSLVSYGDSLTPPSSGNTPTFVYSFANDLWSEFTYNLNVGWPVMFTAQATSKKNATLIAGHHNGTVFFGNFNPVSNSGLLQDTIDATTTPIYQKITLEPVTFGTMNLKAMSRVALIYTGQRVTTAGAVSTESQDFTLFWNDVDNNSVANNVTMPTGYGGFNNFPFWTQIGIFRSRQLSVACSTTNNTSIAYKWKYLEVDINKLQQ